MADREKLIELLLSVPSTEVIFGKREGKRYTTAWHIANHLIANGVTIQEWIPVTERLPQECEHPWITCEVVQVLLNDGAVTVGYCNRGQKLWYHLPLAHTFFVGSSYEKTPVVAWQPLAEPPKGE